MPKKITFDKKGNSYEFEAHIGLSEKAYNSYVRVPIELGRQLKDKKLKVKLEIIEQ